MKRERAINGQLLVKSLLAAANQAAGTVHTRTLGGSSQHGRHVEIPVRGHLGGGDAIHGGVAEVRAMLGGDSCGGGRREPRTLLSCAF